MSLVSVPLPNLQKKEEEDRNQTLERVLLNGVSNEHTRRAYRRTLEKFLAWFGHEDRSADPPARLHTTPEAARNSRARPQSDLRGRFSRLLCAAEVHG